MGPQIAAAFILAFISGIVFLLSYLLGTRKQFSLIAGMDVSKVRDGDGLARLFRAWLRPLAALELLIAVSSVFLSPVGLGVAAAAFGVLHVACVITLIVRMQRYLD